MEKTYIELLVQSGAIGILGVFLYLFVTRILPKFLESLNQQRMEFLSALKDHREETQIMNAGIKMEIREHTQLLRGHTEVINKLSERISAQTEVLRGFDAANTIRRMNREK